jgi:flagellar hook-length control protein FliK
LASSAQALSVQTGAPIPAPQGRSHKSDQSAGGDSFADMLAETDAAAPDNKDEVRDTARQDKAETRPASQKAPKNKAADKAADKTSGKSVDKSTDKSTDKAEEAKADDRDAKAVADKDAGKDAGPGTDEKTEHAANDNDLADLLASAPQPDQPPPQPAPTPPVTLASLTAPAPAAPVQPAPAEAAPDAQAAADRTPDLALAPVAPASAATVPAAPAPLTPAPVAADAATPAAAVPAATAPAIMAAADVAAAPAKPEIKSGQPEKPEAGDAADLPAPATAPVIAEAADKPAPAPKKIAAAAETPARDFHKTLQEDAAAADPAQPRQAEAPQPKTEPNLPQPEAGTADTTKAARPDTNVAALAAPAPAPAPAASGAEKPAVTAQAQAPSLPQPTPDMHRMAVEVAARSQSGAKQFDIRLDPPELGRVEVRLSIDAHGKTEAHLTADQPQTLDLLQKDAPVLARALRDAGLNVQQDGLNFSLKNQQQGFAGQDDQARQGARGGFNNAKTSNETGQPESGAYVRRSLGLLDIRV